MMEESRENEVDFGLKVYEYSENGVPGWMVSGIAKRKGKRWRRRFSTKDKADEFFARELRRFRVETHGGGTFVRTTGVEDRGSGDRDQQTSSDEGESVVGRIAETGSVSVLREYEGKAIRSGKGRVTWSVWNVGLLFVALSVAFVIDSRFRGGRESERGRELLTAGFEGNPILSGWKSVGSDVEWTDEEQVSGRRSIVIREGEWVSPEVPSEALHWYRLAFRCKVLGGGGNGGSLERAGCKVVFVSEKGDAPADHLALAVQSSEKWEKKELRFRTQPVIDAAGSLSGAKMRIEFQSKGAQSFYVDELVLEKTTTVEVGEWADDFYSALPAKLSYRGKESRWRRLSGVMEKLRSHQRVRIVFVGDEIMEDLANAPVDVYLQRLYPGCSIEVVAPSVASGGAEYFNEHMVNRVTKLRPDLVVMGGMGSADGMASLQTVVNQVRANNAVTGRRTEMLLLTNGWSSRPGEGGAFRLTSEMRELDQELDRNSAVPDDYRGQVLRFASQNGVEFLDTMGIASEFIFASAAKANVGPPTGPDGVPFSYWMRDWLHPEESGKQIMGRILEAYFSPSDGSTAGVGRLREGTKPTSVRLFDPERNPRDRETYATTRREFGASAVERPSLALRFAGESPPQDRTGAGTGAAFRVSGQAVQEVGYAFDEPLDVRAGDVVVYWSFRSDREAGEEKSKLTMNLCFTEPTAGGRGDRSQVLLTVRPGGTSILGTGGGRVEHEVEHLVEVPVENFIDRTKGAKFRLLVRWVSGDRVVVEAASWNPRTSRWEGFIPLDRPGAPPLVMDLSVARHLLGTTSFKSISFETQSAVPVLESVLVTMRPSMLR